MIWGNKTGETTIQIENWHMWFALRIVRLNDGRWAWLSHVERRWVEDQNANWAGDSSQWEYREAQVIHAGDAAGKGEA